MGQTWRKTFLGVLAFVVILWVQPVYSQYSCNAVTCHEKTIDFNALQYKYTFKGSWGQGEGRLGFNVYAWFAPDPATLGNYWYPGAGSGGYWHESIAVTTGDNSIASYCVTIKGRSAFDPWLNPYAPVSQVEVSQEGWVGAGSSCLMLDGIADKPFSRCAPTPHDMLQWGLAARNVGPVACTSGQCSPEISRPDEGEAFLNVPGAVGFQFRIYCKFSNYQGKFFAVTIEHQNENGDWVLPGWMDYLHRVDMVPKTGTEQISTGELNLSFDRPGHYRVKASNSIYLDQQTRQESPQLAAVGPVGATAHGMVGCRKFWIGPKQFRQVGNLELMQTVKKQEAADRSAVLPNLAIEAMEVREFAPGEIHQGKTRDTKHVQLLWKAVNKSRVKSDANVLSTGCVSIAGERCPSGLSRSYDVPELPGTADGAVVSEWIGRSEIVPVPEGYFKWNLGARVDNHRDVEESNEQDNDYNGEYHSQMTDARKKLKNAFTPQTKRVSGNERHAIQPGGGINLQEKGGSTMQPAKVDAPDLTADFHQIESTVSGQYALSFKVRNQGTQPSAETGFTVACEKVGGGDCPTWFNGAYALRSLTPSPDDSYEVKTGMPVLLPPPRARYKITAKLDPEEKVAEGPGESNNTVVGYFPTMMQSLQAEGILHEALTQEQAGEKLQQPGLKGSLKTAVGQEALESKTGSVGALSAAGKKVTQSAGGAAGLKGKLQESGAAAVMAKLKLQRMWTVPAAPKAEEPFALHMSLGNQGAAAGGKGELLQVTCTALEGGPCPALGGGLRLGEALAVGGAQTLKLENLRWNAGRYRLTAAPASAPEGKMTMTLKVEERRVVSSSAAAGRTTAGQGGEAISSGAGSAAAAARQGRTAQRISQ